MAVSPTFALDCWIHRLILGFEGTLDPIHYEWMALHEPLCDSTYLSFSWKFWQESAVLLTLRCECGATREVIHPLPFDQGLTPERQALSLEGGWDGQDTTSPVAAWQRYYQATLESSPHSRYTVLRRVLSRDPVRMWLSPHITDSPQYKVSSRWVYSTYPGRLGRKTSGPVLYRGPSISGTIPAVYGPAVPLETT